MPFGPGFQSAPSDFSFHLSYGISMKDAGVRISSTEIISCFFDMCASNEVHSSGTYLDLFIRRPKCLSYRFEARTLTKLYSVANL